MTWIYCIISYVVFTTTTPTGGTTISGDSCYYSPIVGNRNYAISVLHKQQNEIDSALALPYPFPSNARRTFVRFDSIQKCE